MRADMFNKVELVMSYFYHKHLEGKKVGYVVIKDYEHEPVYIKFIDYSNSNAYDIEIYLTPKILELCKDVLLIEEGKYFSTMQGYLDQKEIIEKASNEIFGLYAFERL